MKTKRKEKKLQTAERLARSCLAIDRSVRVMVEKTLPVWFTENIVSATETLEVILNAARQMNNTVLTAQKCTESVGWSWELCIELLVLNSWSVRTLED